MFLHVTTQTPTHTCTHTYAHTHNIHTCTCQHTCAHANIYLSSSIRHTITYIYPDTQHTYMYKPPHWHTLVHMCMHTCVHTRALTHMIRADLGSVSRGQSTHEMWHCTHFLIFPQGCWAGPAHPRLSEGNEAHSQDASQGPSERGHHPSDITLSRSCDVPHPAPGFPPATGTHPHQGPEAPGSEFSEDPGCWLFPAGLQSRARSWGGAAARPRGLRAARGRAVCPVPARAGLQHAAVLKCLLGSEDKPEKLCAGVSLRRASLPWPGLSLSLS